MNKLRVLIVDDERIVADSLSLIFEKYGFTVQVAYTAGEGLDCARAFLPELLLTDLSMPGMGGLLMASHIAQEQPACRILVLTGDYRALEEARTTGSYRFGSHSIVTKPVHPEALLREAKELLDGSNPGFLSAQPTQ